jgi:hypothetical protein
MANRRVDPSRVGLLVVAIVCIVVAVPVFLGGENPSPSPRQSLSLNMAQLTTLLQERAVITSLPPLASLKDAVNDLKSDVALSDGLARLNPVFLDGIDPWDRPLIYRYDPPTDVVTIKSLGPNGIDENGGGDDVQISVKVRDTSGAVEAK